MSCDGIGAISARAVRQKKSFVLVHRPAKIFSACFGDHLRGVRWIYRDAMFESVIADVMQELLEAIDLRHRAMAEGFKLIVGCRALADISANDAGSVVGREPRISQRP